MQNFTLVPQLGAGRGRLVRVGDTIVYSAGDAAAASSLIGWCRLVGQRPADEVMPELTRLGAGGSSLGAFCAVVIGDHGLDVLVHGGVPLVAATPTGPQHLSDGQTHLHEVTSLDLIIGNAQIDPLLSLTEGVVAADGFSLRAKMEAALPWGSAPSAPTQPMAGIAEAVPTAAAAPAAAETPVPQPSPTPEASQPVPVAAGNPMADPPAASPVRPAMVSLTDITGDDLPAASPLPVVSARAAATPQQAAVPAAGAQGATSPQPVQAPAPSPGPAPAATSSGPQPVKVKGLVCARGHFNDPRTRFCATCGIAMHQTSFILSEDVRPPLGVLVMSDGTYHTLITSLVFGRDPDDDREVREGRAQGVTLIDPGNTISRVHAEIRAVDWDVHIVDHGSTNGTFIWSNDRQQWDRLTPEQSVPLMPGSHVSFGRLTATFESSARQKS